MTKHSSLFGTFVSYKKWSFVNTVPDLQTLAYYVHYGRKMFYNISPGDEVNKTAFFVADGEYK